MNPLALKNDENRNSLNISKFFNSASAYNVVLPQSPMHHLSIAVKICKNFCDNFCQIYSIPFVWFLKPNFETLRISTNSFSTKLSISLSRSYYSNVFFIILILLSWNVLNARLLDTSVSCDQSNFDLSLNFDFPFNGIIYTEDGFPNCVYVNGTMLSRTTYQLKIPLMGCETHINSDGNYENAIIVQENAAFLQGTDKKYLLTCIPSTPLLTPAPRLLGMDDALSKTENAITVDFGGVTVENIDTTTEVIHSAMAPDDSPSASSLKYAVEIRNGHSLDSPPLSAPLNIGDRISYIVRLQKPVAHSQIGRCWAGDSKSNLELSNEHGCTLQPRGSIWSSFDRIETAKEVIFVNRIKAWAFSTSNEVNIFCNLRICMSRVCTFSNCTTETRNFFSSKPLRSGDDFRSRARRHHDHFGKITSIQREVDHSETMDFMSDMTEIETLSTQLRFRRQSIQQQRVSPMNLVIADELEDSLNSAPEVNNNNDNKQQPPLINNANISKRLTNYLSSFTQTKPTKAAWFITSLVVFVTISLLTILLYLTWRRRKELIERIRK